MPRFHLSFDYDSGHHVRRSIGSQVVIANNLDEAVAQIARERELKQIHIIKRFRFGEPACEAEIIDRVFNF